MKKPPNAEYFGWDEFLAWCERVGVSTEHDDDWLPSWQCWQTAYLVAINSM